MPKKEIVGTGITKREIIWLDVTGREPGDIVKLRNALREEAERDKAALERCGDRWGVKTENMRKACENTLAEAEPKYRDRYRKLIEEMERKGERDTRPWWKVLAFKEDTPEWFAQKIMTLLRLADVRRNNPESVNDALIASLDASRLYTMARFKYVFEPDIITRKGQVKNRRDSAPKGGAATAAKREERFETLNKLIIENVGKKFACGNDGACLNLAYEQMRIHVEEAKANGTEQLFLQGGKLLSHDWLEDTWYPKNGERVKRQVLKNISKVKK